MHLCLLSLSPPSLSASRLFIYLNFDGHECEARIHTVRAVAAAVDDVLLTHINKQTTRRNRHNIAKTFYVRLCACCLRTINLFYAQLISSILLTAIVHCESFTCRPSVELKPATDQQVSSILSFASIENTQTTEQPNEEVTKKARKRIALNRNWNARNEEKSSTV